jgi:hypothetical protein
MCALVLKSFHVFVVIVIKRVVYGCNGSAKLTLFLDGYQV